MTGVELIAAERERQVRSIAEGGEGWDDAHDAGHANDLAAAGASYATPPHRRTMTNRRREEPVARQIPVGWPWLDRWWKPTPNDRVRELVKAGALIAAAIDVLEAETTERVASAK